MVDHVADIFTNFDVGTINRAHSAAIWLANYVSEHKIASVIFAAALGGASSISKQLVNHLSEVTNALACLPLPVRLVIYQSLMFARVFVGGIIVGTSPLFTTPIGLIESKVYESQGADPSMFIILAASVLPNLICKIPGFSEYFWLKLHKFPPLGSMMSNIMEEAFEEGSDTNEKAGNAIVIGHFTPGSGTFSSLVACVFVSHAFDLVISGSLGVFDDLALNIMTKFKTPTLALHDAKYMITAALLFKIFHNGHNNHKRDAILFAINLTLVHLLIFVMENALQDENHNFLEKFFPTLVLFTSAIGLPWVEKAIFALVDGVFATPDSSSEPVNDPHMDTLTGTRQWRLSRDTEQEE